jgi:hypothetical protein
MSGSTRLKFTLLRFRWIVSKILLQDSRLWYDPGCSVPLLIAERSVG